MIMISFKTQRATPMCSEKWRKKQINDVDFCLASCTLISLPCVSLQKNDDSYYLKHREQKQFIYFLRVKMEWLHFRVSAIVDVWFDRCHDIILKNFNLKRLMAIWITNCSTKLYSFDEGKYLENILCECNPVKEIEMSFFFAPNFSAMIRWRDI